MAAGQRLSSVLAHLHPLSETSGRANVLRKNSDDIVRPSSLFSHSQANKNTGNHLRSPHSAHESKERRPERHPDR